MQVGPATTSSPTLEMSTPCPERSREMSYFLEDEIPISLDRDRSSHFGLQGILKVPSSAIWGRELSLSVSYKGTPGLHPQQYNCQDIPVDIWVAKQEGLSCLDR